MVAVGKHVFTSWAAAQGVQSPSLTLTERANDRSMICDENVVAGQDILHIPIDACITSDNIESLAERLAHERGLGSKSKFAPYIDVLPTLEDADDGENNKPSLLALPRFWSASRLEKVTDSGQLDARLRMDERKDIDPWALACVDSRANFLGDGTYSMTPLLDMINHDSSVLTTARVDRNKGFEGPGDILHLAVGKEFSKGEEVFISYGDLTNLDTLCDYGFVAKDNFCNSESIGVQLIRRPPLTLTVYADGTVDAGSKATLRYYLANEEELEQFPSFEEGLGLGILTKKISDRNELDVTSFIASTLAEAADDATTGAADAGDDFVVEDYLNARSKLLQMGVQRILAKFPDLEY